MRRACRRTVTSIFYRPVEWDTLSMSRQSLPTGEDSRFCAMPTPIPVQCEAEHTDAFIICADGVAGLPAY